MRGLRTCMLWAVLAFGLDYCIADPAQAADAVRPSRTKEAYVTLLYGDSFLLGVRVLGQSLRQTGTTRCERATATWRRCMLACYSPQKLVWIMFENLPGPVMSSSGEYPLAGSGQPHCYSWSRPIVSAWPRWYSCCLMYATLMIHAELSCTEVAADLGLAGARQLAAPTMRQTPAARAASAPERSTSVPVSSSPPTGTLLTQCCSQRSASAVNVERSAHAPKRYSATPGRAYKPLPKLLPRVNNADTR